MAKRLSKADIYAKYNIIYKAGKIVTPIGTMCELLKDGNSKTGKDVPRAEKTERKSSHLQMRD